MAKLLSHPPQRLHHHAYVVRDQEANRHFFEDLLGIPLVATWCERHFQPAVGREVDFCHTFYALADGGALAFFCFADDEVYRKTQAARPAEIGNFHHVAFKVDDAGYDELLSGLTAAGAVVREPTTAIADRCTARHRTG
jgi:catechol 2,3-dioxygenase-like lactoylglutathione lyase family enzyme